MKKNLLMGLSALVLLGTVAGCGGNSSSSSSQGGSSSDPLAGTYDIKVWVSETEGVASLTEQQIDEFEAANPGIVLNATIEGVGEATSATNMITDVESGADIFCFAQDQLARLVQVGALNKLGVAASEQVKALNDAGAVKAATVDGNLYCYPLTSDNGYFMFYDKSVIKESSLDSLEAIIADCEAAGRNFSFETDTSGWYNASWFFATGCKSDWTVGDDGKFASVDDTFNSDAGLIALKGMRKLGSSKCHVSSSAGSDFAAAIPSAVVVTGTWETNTIKGILGDNFGATDLPSFEVDGKSYHLGSFSGNKLMGVKPQLDSKKAAVLQKLALYLTNEECQLERFNAVGWGPSNLAAQANEAVQADTALTALAKQSPYAVPQGQIHGSWWDISKSYATVACKDDPAATDEELKAALEAYEKSIKGLFSMTTEEKLAFGLVGSFEGGSWDTDTAMEAKEVDGQITFMTTQPILFAAGNELKVRQGRSWDVSFGNGTANYVVSEAEAGYRFVKMVLEGTLEEPKGATITLEKYNPTYSWSVIGTACGSNWDKDFYMEYLGNGVHVSAPLNLTAGEEYKVRYGTSWDKNYGQDGVAGGANIAVAATGTYQVKLTLTGEGENVTATVELVPAA